MGDVIGRDTAATAVSEKEAAQPPARFEPKSWLLKRAMELERERREKYGAGGLAPSQSAKKKKKKKK